MTYSKDMRLAALAYINKGGTQSEAVKIFGVSRDSLLRWSKAKSLERQTGFTRRRKIDADKLKAHVQSHPQMYLRERAEIFGVAVNSMHYALKRLGFVKKTRRDTENAVLCKGRNI
jgi:putative transposase